MSKKPATQKGSKKVQPAKTKGDMKPKKEAVGKEPSPKEQLKSINDGIEFCMNTLSKLVRETPIDTDNLSVIAISARINLIKNKQQFLLVEKQILESQLLEGE